MFDSVGRNLDEDATKRSAQSLFIVSLIAGGVGVAILAAGLWTVREVVLPELLDDDPVEIALDEEIDDLEAPPPPPPPPPPPAAADVEEDEDDEEDEPTPDDMVEEITELKEEIKEEMKSDDKPKGVEGGMEGGVEGGVVGGVIGGVEGGVLGGQLGGGGARVVHHSAVEVKKRVQPDYPAAARGLGLGEQVCKVTVNIDEDGNPTRVAIDGCPKVFHANTEEAIMKWRWYPYRENGQKQAVQFRIVVRYKEVG